MEVYGSYKIVPNIHFDKFPHKRLGCFIENIFALKCFKLVVGKMHVHYVEMLIIHYIFRI